MFSQGSGNEVFRHRSARGRIRARLLARGFVLGARLRDRSGARADRPCVRRPRTRNFAGWCTRQQSGFATGAGEMRLSVDWRAPDAHSRHQFGGAERSFPSRSRIMGLAQGLGGGRGKWRERAKRRLTATDLRPGRMRKTAPVWRPEPDQNDPADWTAQPGPSSPSHESGRGHCRRHAGDPGPAVRSV